MGVPEEAAVDDSRGALKDPELPAEAVRIRSVSQSLEEKARQALACPCVAELHEGPCGAEFSEAFLCFVKSEEPDQGSDCVEPFKNMQRCMLANDEAFKYDKPDDPKYVDAQDDSTTDKSPWKNPPMVPENMIKLPLWYTKSSISKSKV